VGRPGVTYDAVEYAQEIAAFTLRSATAPSDAPTVETVIDAIMAQVSERVAC